MSSIVGKVDTSPSRFQLSTISWEKLTSFCKEVFWVALGKILVVTGGFFSVYLLTNWLAPAVYGELAFVLAFVALGQVYFTTLYHGVLRFVKSADDTNELATLIASVRVLVSRVIRIKMAIVILVVGLTWIVGYPVWAFLFACASLLILVSGTIAMREGVQVGLRYRFSVALQKGLYHWIRIAGLVLIVWGFGFETSEISSEWVIAGFTGGMLCLLAYQHIQIRSITSVSFSSSEENLIARREWIDRIHRYSVPFLGVGLVVYAQMYADRWALQLFASSTEQGLYAVVWLLGFSPMVIFTGFTAELLQPIFFARAGDASDSERVSVVIRQNHYVVIASFIVGVLGALAAWLLHDFVFQLVTQPEYQRASHYMPWLVLSGGLFAAGNTAGRAMMIASKPGGLVMPYALSAVVAVVTTFLLTYFYGIQGTVIATPIHYLFFLIIMLVAANSSQEQLPETT